MLVVSLDLVPAVIRDDGVGSGEAIERPGRTAINDGLHLLQLTGMDLLVDAVEDLLGLL